MPAKSKNQQQAAAMALQAKKGQISKGQLKGAARDMFESMSAKELREYASTKRTGKVEEKQSKASSSGKKRGPGRPPKKTKGS